MIGITILGSTGSVGVSTLAVLNEQRQRFRVVALTANRSVDDLFSQCLQWQPEFAVMLDADAAVQLELRLQNQGCQTQVLSGVDSLVRVTELAQVDYVMAAIVGAAGLVPTLAAVTAGKRVLLANKEALVMSGQIFIDAVEQGAGDLLPIDSEHNALFQCLPAGQARQLDQAGVRRLLLTGSGGPFLDTPLAQLADVTPEQACAHPNWQMGRKISVDSATMMNKGLEFIEAHWLFAATVDQIEIVIHPQSVIHSLVEYCDGSVLAQLGNPDMRTPIAHALAWPERMATGVTSLDLFDIGRLDFRSPDYQRFPCLQLAVDALNAGGTATAILNAANEIAVQAFLAEQIHFTDIAPIIEATLTEVTVQDADTLETVLNCDQQARLVAQQWLDKAALSASA